MIPAKMWYVIQLISACFWFLISDYVIIIGKTSMSSQFNPHIRRLQWVNHPWHVSMCSGQLVSLWDPARAWWRHQMETFSALLAICAGTHRSPVNSPHKGQWRGALMFTLICARTNGWVNNREAGDLRRHGTHYDVIVMALCNIEYPSETHLNPKSREIPFAHILFLSCSIVFKCCTEYGSDTVVLCAKFQNDWTFATDVMENEYSRDLRLRWVSDGYPILHKAPG